MAEFTGPCHKLQQQGHYKSAFAPLAVYYGAFTPKLAGLQCGLNLRRLLMVQVQHDTKLGERATEWQRKQQRKANKKNDVIQRDHPAGGKAIGAEKADAITI